MLIRTILTILAKGEGKGEDVVQVKEYNNSQILTIIPTTSTNHQKTNKQDIKSDCTF